MRPKINILNQNKNRPQEITYLSERISADYSYFLIKGSKFGINRQSLLEYQYLIIRFLLWRYRQAHCLNYRQMCYLKMYRQNHYQKYRYQKCYPEW